MFLKYKLFRITTIPLYVEYITAKDFLIQNYLPLQFKQRSIHFLSLRVLFKHTLSFHCLVPNLKFITGLVCIAEQGKMDYHTYLYNPATYEIIS